MTLVLALAGNLAMVHASAGSNRDEENLWRLMAALEQALPFRKDAVERMTGIPLVRDPQLESGYEGSNGEEGRDVFGIEIRRVLLKVAVKDPLEHALLALDTSPLCISPDVLRQHYGGDGQLRLPSLHGPPGTVVVFVRTWGEVAFEYRDECIRGIVLTPTEFNKFSR